MPIHPIHKVYLGVSCFRYISHLLDKPLPLLSLSIAQNCAHGYDHGNKCCIMAEEGEGEAEAANPFQRQDKVSQSVFGTHSEL